jgi:hypothetical protein
LWLSYSVAFLFKSVSLESVAVKTHSFIVGHHQCLAFAANISDVFISLKGVRLQVGFDMGF